MQQGIENIPALKSTSVQYVDNVIINIQLPYNLNNPIEPELWGGNFHPISLHGFIKYLTSDTKNIRNLLNCIAKYIGNKQINPKRSNNMEDLKGVGEAIWNLISSVYQPSWDSLHADNSSNSLRQKFILKFTLKVKPIMNGNNTNKNKMVSISIKKLSLPIPTKSSKEVKEISKFSKT